MSTQRFYQLLIAFGSITLIALASERSHVLASFVTVIPVNIMLGIWFLYTSTGGDTAIIAGYTRMVLCGLFPVMLFTSSCWLGFRQGWSLRRVLVVSCAVWLAATVVYRGIEWWVSTRRG